MFGEPITDQRIHEIVLTEVFTPTVPGRVNIRAGGTYCLLVEATLSPGAQEYLSKLATPLLAAAERSTYGTTDLEIFGLAVAMRLRQSSESVAQEILAALKDHKPETWFTRVPKP